jgi:hypothetical protein
MWSTRPREKEKEDLFFFAFNMAAASEPSAGGGGKYPRTPHLPFSPGRSDDDVSISSLARLVGPQADEVVLTEKLDGGNCCLKDGLVFARSHAAPATQPWFSYTKQVYLTEVYPVIDAYLELLGENLFAVHSIPYSDESHPLPSPFYLFGALDRDVGHYVSWDDVERIADSVSLPTPPVLFRGKIGSVAELADRVQQLMAAGSRVGKPGCPMEGVVVRTTAPIQPDHFEVSVAKFVRPGHNQIDDATFAWAWQRAHISR